MENLNQNKLDSAPANKEPKALQKWRSKALTLCQYAQF